MTVSVELSPWQPAPFALDGEIVFAVGDVHGCAEELGHLLDAMRDLAHGVACSFAGTLDFGPSDHKPIVLDLQVAEARVRRHPLQRARRRLVKIRAAFR